jgi:Acetyltransferase (GNAT) domain
MKIKSIVRDLSEQARSLASFKVKWADHWGAEYDDALAALPEMPSCSHELFRKLALNPAEVAKRFALLTRGGEPIAIIGLRKRLDDWLFLTDGAIPWCLFPAIDGEHRAALAAVNTTIHCLQRVDPSVYGFRYVMPFEIYRADLTKDFEGYWRETGYRKEIMTARRRTSDLSVRANVPSDFQWVIQSWMERWRDDPEQQVTIGPDALLAGHELLESGRMHVVALVDGERPVAGMTLYVHENDVVEQIYSWDQSLRKSRVGIRIRDAAFQWAATRGFRRYDLGGGSEYKWQWAPTDGQRYFAVFQPASRYLFRGVCRKASGATERLANLVRWQSRSKVG